MKKQAWIFRYCRRPFVLGIAILLILFTSLFFTAPRFLEVQKQAIGTDRVLLAQDGEVLQISRTDFSKRRLAWLPIQQFSPILLKVLVQAEDQRFYWHGGVDPLGLVRALGAMIQGHSIQGASTITMQVSDLIQPEVLIANKTIRKGSLLHKMRQILRAIQLEMRWSKDQILETYVNLIHLRGELQGFPAASYGFLNKHPLSIDVDEAIALVASISSPNLKVERLERKACILKARIFASKDQSCDVQFKNRVQQIYSKPARLILDSKGAPHLAQRLFQANKIDSVLNTTLDLNLQKKVQEILNRNIERLKLQRVQDAAAIVIENKSGKVLAYVGAVDQSPFVHVDGVIAQRQAGSALKPFLYAKAIDSKTVTATSILLDDPTVLSWEGQVYRPTNYDRQFHGPVSLREALASSLNVPAVKIVTIIGLHQTYKVLLDIGLTNLKEPDFYGVSMALGAVEVRLEELANAYRMLANKGQWSPLQWISSSSQSSQTSEGASPLPASRTVFSEGASYIISSILSDANARLIGFGWDTPLETPFWTAVKTGTSKDYRDNWCVGFSEDYTVGVWAGNFDAKPMDKVSGVSGAGPSWYEIMTELHKTKKSAAPQMPSAVVKKTMRYSWASQEVSEYFIAGTEPVLDLIEPSREKQIQFIFPVEGSTLVKDPHLDPDLIALFVRYKGEVPKESALYMDGHRLGLSVSPFRIDKPEVGLHQLEIRDSSHHILSRVKFRIK